jgi:hypothetical protein
VLDPSLERATGGGVSGVALDPDDEGVGVAFHAVRIMRPPRFSTISVDRATKRERFR